MLKSTVKILTIKSILINIWDWSEGETPLTGQHNAESAHLCNLQHSSHNTSEEGVPSYEEARGKGVDPAFFIIC